MLLVNASSQFELSESCVAKESLVILFTPRFSEVAGGRSHQQTISMVSSGKPLKRLSFR